MKRFSRIDSVLTMISRPNFPAFRSKAAISYAFPDFLENFFYAYDLDDSLKPDNAVWDKLDSAFGQIFFQSDLQRYAETQFGLKISKIMEEGLKNPGEEVDENGYATLYAKVVKAAGGVMDSTKALTVNVDLYGAEIPLTGKPAELAEHIYHCYLRNHFSSGCKEILPGIAELDFFFDDSGAKVVEDPSSSTQSAENPYQRKMSLGRAKLRRHLGVVEMVTAEVIAKINCQITSFAHLDEQWHLEPKWFEQIVQNGGDIVDQYLSRCFEKSTSLQVYTVFTLLVVSSFSVM